MAKKTKTFAQRAKSLINMYKRADFDPVEKAELDGALKKLAQEQEDYKMSNNIDNNTNEYKNGTYNLDYDFQGYTPQVKYNVDYNTNPYSMDNVNKALDLKLSQPEYLTDRSADPVIDANNEVTNDGLKPYKSSMIPSLISGAMSTAGNLFLANQAKKNVKKLRMPRVAAEEVNLAGDRESIKRDFTTAKAAGRRNIKSASQGRGQYLTNTLALDADLAEKEADLISQSQQKEDITNAQERSRINQLNANYRAQEEQANLAQDARAEADRLAYISSAIQGVPQMMSDIRKQKSQDALIASLGTDYKLMKDKKGNLVYKYMGGKQ